MEQGVIREQEGDMDRLSPLLTFAPSQGMLIEGLGKYTLL